MFFQEVSSVLLLDKYGNDMLCSMLFLSLGFDVLTDYFYRCPSCRQKAEALAPECFLPKFFPAFRILFFQQPATGTFISIDKFTEFRLWLCAEHHINMVCIVIPFFQYDPVSGCDILKDLFCSFEYFVVQYFSSVFYNCSFYLNEKLNSSCGLSQ